MKKQQKRRVTTNLARLNMYIPQKKVKEDLIEKSFKRKFIFAVNFFILFFRISRTEIVCNA